jgi:hypothetical protein
MPRKRPFAILALAIVATVLPATPSAARPATLQTGVDEAEFVFGDDPLRSELFDSTVEANAGIVRLDVFWSRVAPQRPANPADPADPGYDFRELDAAVREAAARNLDVILMTHAAPRWAEGRNRPGSAQAGSWKPDPDAVATFTGALAQRYSGSFAGPGGVLPRVTKYQVWNESNLSIYLSPQWQGKRLVAQERYRQMLNRSYDTVKAVHGDNLVLTAGMAPYGDKRGEERSRPMLFLRQLFCLRDDKLKPDRCKQPAKFDILAAHPINLFGGPTDHAFYPDDASTADLFKIRRTLRVAERFNTLGTSGSHPLWATEFWWLAKTKNQPKGHPDATQARYYQQALYEIWRQGASVAMILQMRDPRSRKLIQTGLERADGSRRPSFTAFRFPFVVDARGKGKLTAWTRPPAAGALTIERKSGGGWKPVASVQVQEDQIVTRSLRGGGKRFRAVLNGEASLTWRVK